MTTRLLLVGGSSEIAVAIGRRLAADGPVRPFLLGRDRSRLEAALASLEQAGCQDGMVGILEADDLDAHQREIGRAFEAMDGADVVVLAIGVLGAQEGLDADPAEATQVMRVNFLDCGSLMLHCLRELRRRGTGTLVVLSTVAAERPRAANAIYGAAKAGLDALAQGLSDSIAGDSVRVLVVRPGFVVTRMTAGLPHPPMATTPELVAERTVRGLREGSHTVWAPGALRYVFSGLRHLPRPVFRRLPL